MSPYCKDGLNEFPVNRNENAINVNRQGTKAALNFDIHIKAGSPETIRLRLRECSVPDALDDFDNVFNERIREANSFYYDLQKNIQSEDEKIGTAPGVCRHVVEQAVFLL